MNTKTSPNLEHIFISQSIERFGSDLLKLLQLIPDLTSEQCYKTMCQIDAVKENIQFLEKKIKTDYVVFKE